jgi:CTP:molybdopterin cytidylyltransferase MocA
MAVQAFSSVAVAILASGAPDQSGHSKQLVVHNGETLIRSVVEKVSALGCGRVGVVLGARIDDVLPELDGFDVSLIVNDNWREGSGTSIRTAVQWASTRPCEALLLVPAEEVDFTTQELLELLQTWSQSRGNVAYESAAGIPAVVDAASFGQILQLGDTEISARYLLRYPPAQSAPFQTAARDANIRADVAVLTN